MPKFDGFSSILLDSDFIKCFQIGSLKPYIKRIWKYGHTVSINALVSDTYRISVRLRHIVEVPRRKKYMWLEEEMQTVKKTVAGDCEEEDRGRRRKEPVSEEED